MIKHFKAAFRPRLDDGDPTDEEVAAWIAHPKQIPVDIVMELERRGITLDNKRLEKQTSAVLKPMMAMNRLNRKNKLSPKTIAELDRLRKEKLAG